ncbi:MAG: TonB-dependent receptor [Pedobacter sp.]|nr:TonB-dependent receptor [Chitinophagaceae bacterium]
MKQLFIFFLWVICQQSNAQKLIITGSVKDGITKEALNRCNILLINSKVGTVTNANGSFTLGLLAATANAKLIISYLGYKSDTISIEFNKTNYTIYLQPIAGNLNEVVVTGVSRATLLRENPVAITNVSPKTIDRTVEPNIIDALVKNVPGLNAVKTGPNISKPFIRGLGYNRVLTLYDGMRQEGQQWGDEHGIEVDGYNIDKAEVIKGPASLMFGSDAVAGVVSLFPYLPKEKDGNIYGRLLSEYQSNNGLIGNGFRLGFNNGQWLWIVRGSYRLAKNYTNTIDGRVYNTGFKETNLAATIGHTSAKGYSNFNATLYDNLQGIPDGSRDSLTRKFTKQIYEGALDDITKRPIVNNQELNSYTLSPLHQHIQHYRVYCNNHYQLGNGEIDATIGFQQNVRREYSHPTAPQQAGLFVRLNTINYGLRYNAPSFSNVDFTVGVNGMYQNNKSKNATDFPIPDYNLLDIGGYVYAKWKQQKLTISGGLRYDTRHLISNNFYVGNNPTNGFDKQYFLADTSGATLQFPSLNKNFTGISLSLGFTYQLTELISLKANVARGYRSPSVTEIASNGLDPGAHIIYLGNRYFVPEFSFQQDLGLTFANKNMVASLSIFNNNLQHYIYLTQMVDASGDAIVDAQGNKTFQYQQAAAQLYGLEASMDVHPIAWKGFSFNNNIALTYGISKQKTYANKGINGEYLPLIPPVKWLSSIAQEIKTTSKIFTSFNAKTELEFGAAQNRYLALYNTETATPAYSLINVSFGTQINYTKTNTLQLQMQINNLLNVSYQSNLSRLKYFEYYNQSPNGHLGMYNMGRNICIKLIVAF